MQLWVWIAIAFGALLLAAAAVLFALMGWRAYQRRVLLKLLVRTEGIEAAASALREAVTRLAGASDDDIAAFATDSESPERRTLHEVRSRSLILTDELDRMPVPAKLLPAAEAIADAAAVVGEQAGVVADDDGAGEALDHLGGIDLARVAAYLHKARTLLAHACEKCGFEDTAVYGGGLYL